MAIIIDGKETAKKIRENLRIKVDSLKQNGVLPKLAVIMVGEDGASRIYVRNKSKVCEELGIQYEEYLLKEDSTQEELLELIRKLNERPDVHGILLQSPIPQHELRSRPIPRCHGKCHESHRRIRSRSSPNGRSRRHRRVSTLSQRTPDPKHLRW